MSAYELPAKHLNERHVFDLVADHGVPGNLREATATLHEKRVINGTQVVPARVHHLDWLRVFATLLLIPFHCLEAFGFNAYYINASNRAYPYEVAANLIHLWHMPLFFFIAGYASTMVMQANAPQRFIASRLRRLGVPLAFGMLTFVPLVGYMSDKSEKGAVAMSFVEYYPWFFRFHQGDLAGFTGGLSTHHLWFLVYLLGFSLIGVALFRWLETPAGRRLLERLSDSLSHSPYLLFLAVLPLAAAHESTGAYPSPLYFALFFTIGLLVARDRRLEDALSSVLPAALAIVIVMTPAVLLAFTRQSADAGLAIVFFDVESYLSRLAIEIVALSWLLVIWCLAARFLTRSNQVLNYLNTGSIAIYLLHFVFVVAMLRLVIDTEMSNLAAVVLASCGALVMTVAVYEVFVRRFRWARFLLGIAPQRAE